MGHLILFLICNSLERIKRYTALLFLLFLFISKRVEKGTIPLLPLNNKKNYKKRPTAPH